MAEVAIPPIQVLSEAIANLQNQRYCLYFYEGKCCPKGETCTYFHKRRTDLEQVKYISGNDFVTGKERNHQKPCRFYRKGRCFHQQFCRFLHDNGDANPIESENFRNNSNNRTTSPCSSNSLDADNKNFIEPVKTPNNEFNILEMNNTENCTITMEKNDNNLETEEAAACASPPLTVVDASWVNAPEFVPKGSRPKSYAEALNSETITENKANIKLCPYVNKDGICRNLTDCTYLHGEMCDMCERLILHPYNEEQRKRHRQECLKQHEKNMELSFAIARSKEKSCGVCFEIVMEKASGEQRFGILPNCNHCFCLSCIRKWRQARQFENKIIRACPECRVTSDFVCPSMYWVDTKEDKEKLILDYKNALARKDCKYFKKGLGKCPFGNKCFYLHALPDGSKCDVGPPPRQRRPRNTEPDMELLQQVMLWDFLDERDFPWQSLADDLEDLVSFFTDSDETDWSDYELFLD